MANLRLRIRALDEPRYCGVYRLGRNALGLATSGCSHEKTGASVCEPTKRDGELFGAGQEYQHPKRNARRHRESDLCGGSPPLCLGFGQETPKGTASWDIVQCGLFAATY
jgi:hypothetical protein